ncbi:MAG: arylesterase [Proteobacteria bacterium]|nr:arylesterase [Pseudomonadota bacterium]
MVLFALAVNTHFFVAAAAERAPVRIVALGDSLTAGLGLGPGEAPPDVLARLLKAKGYEVTIENAGVSGDTTAGGLARLDWSVPEGTDAVILELGANDMLTGQPVERARQNLDKIIKRLKARGIEVLLTGMRASRNLGDTYADAFDRIFPELASANGVLFYPFFLDGVALDPKLNQSDGIHPTTAGAKIIAERLLPLTERLIAAVEARRKAVQK